MNNHGPESPAPKHRIKDSAIFAVVLCVIAVAFLWQNYRISALQEQMKIDLAMYNAGLKANSEYIGKMRGDLYRNGYTLNPDELPIYGFPRGSLAITTSVTVPLRLPLPDRVEKLATLLSCMEFDGLPIQIKTIKNIDNKRIAVVDLQHKTGVLPYHSDSWETTYFQDPDPDKGAYASAILTHTLLQPDYKGEWIDGVEFLLQGKPISQPKQLSGTLLRKKKPE